MLLSIPILAAVNYYIFGELLEELPIPSISALLQTIAVGMLIPLMSSLLPVLKIMKDNLNDLLSFSRSAVKTIAVEILSQAKANPQLTFGTIAILYGVALCYVLPYAMISMNATILL